MRKVKYSYLLQVLAFALVMFAPALASAQIVGGVDFAPQNRPITPFGYGDVRTIYVSHAGATGQSWCLTPFTKPWTCHSVSGGNSCANVAPVGEFVSCTQTIVNVDETAFQPINCNGQANGDGGVSGLLSSADWCLVAGYMSSRLVDTVYEYTDYVRVGVNRRFGGTVFELYGTDKVDRIMQAGGGAVQLSLWSNDATFPTSPSQVGYFAAQNGSNWDFLNSCNAAASTSYTSMSSCQANNPGLSCQAGIVGANVSDCIHSIGCADNGWSQGGPFNPIQAIAAGCGWGNTSAAVNSVVSTNTNSLTVGRSNPNQFTKSTPLNGLTWSETTSVFGPYAVIDYSFTYKGIVKFMPDFQEIPAIFTHQGINASLYYYGGSSPYADATSSVTQVQGASLTNTQVFQLPNRAGPFGAGASQLLSEDWISACDASGTKCITVASFAPLAQDIVFGPNQGGTYLGIHGFFNIGLGRTKVGTVFLFPYRFDDVVNGKTIRQWIYDIRAHRLTSPT